MIDLLKYALAIPQFYFVFYTWFMFFTVVCAVIFKLRYRPAEDAGEKRKRFALMLPAYKASNQLLHVIDACFAQKYPAEKYDVFVLAQHCSAELVQTARARGAHVCEKTFDDSPGNPYLFALNFFIESIQRHAGNRPYDAVVLIDKDNLLQDNFLTKINQRLQEGYLAVQGRRRPFNLDTNAACFDYISETMNDQMLRSAKSALGLSAEVSGSGMAFDFNVYKRAISGVDARSPVHDKTFFLELLKMNIHVFYEPEAILFEEKTESYQAITQQRTRWIGGQFYLFKHNFFKLLRLGLQRRQWDPIDYAITLFKIPRALHVLGLGGWIVWALLFPRASMISAAVWASYSIGYFASIIFFLLLDKAPAPVYRALASSPLFIGSMVKSAIRSMTQKLQGKFIHTAHSKEVSLKDIK
ncbi:MAG: glycosyltransferase family 2 protein [Candidatus Zhuqueibacterota bacterium]